MKFLENEKCHFEFPMQFFVFYKNHSFVKIFIKKAGKWFEMQSGVGNKNGPKH